MLKLSSRRARALAAVLLAWVVAGCHQETPHTDVLARVGDRELRAAEFAQQVKAQQAKSPLPVNQRLMLDEWVAREVMLQAARKSGLAEDPEVQDILANILIGKLKERNLSAQLEAAAVSDEEVKTAYENERGQLMAPERARIAILFTPTGPGSSGPVAAKEKMDKALSLARADVTGPQAASLTGFGALAIDYSEDQESRYKGGDLGWVEHERYPRRIEPAAIEAGFRLTKSGEISQVITGSKGLYLVKLLEKQAAAPKAFEQVAGPIRQRLLLKKRATIESDFQQNLRKGVAIEIHAEKLTDTPASQPVPPSIQ